jgi:lipoprotein-anchoring transpeptidase ErfK/SrfK
VKQRRVLQLIFLFLAALGIALAQEEPPPEQPSEPPPPPPTSQVVGQEQPPAPEATPAPEPAKEAPPKPRKPHSRKSASPQQKHDDLEKDLAALAPKGIYILIDTGANRLYLMRNRCVLRAAVCSTGSGRFLPDPPHNREWTFDTPKGEFKIQRKVVNPVWIKPDWAFIEEGEPIPKNSSDRLAPEELGDYAMDLGDGYLIHGTLYERSLGMSVTHGCVRLGAKDLEAVFKSVKIGTSVYIF